MSGRGNVTSTVTPAATLTVTLTATVAADLDDGREGAAIFAGILVGLVVLAGLVGVWAVLKRPRPTVKPNDMCASFIKDGTKGREDGAGQLVTITCRTVPTDPLAGTPLQPVPPADQWGSPHLAQQPPTEPWDPSWGDPNRYGLQWRHGG
eukprot:TRINITY_DN19128_c0_g1_i1.p1 TRINITY_DN19128_c0_g1~~TRINITY_DN19128_c0_g1_i1.p1  ORF type:complete len:150 (+),score=15.59 TRINITY_DN19128_c0_g1_i1:54-503(+)